MEHDTFERDYWGDCTNTFDEEQKHYTYARYMGIPQVGYAFDARGKSVLDIGGGPVSMLLKCKNVRGSFVIDPLVESYPPWVIDRYGTKGIACQARRGEDVQEAFLEAPFDEAWIYNVLQHTDDPAKVVANAKAVAPVLRIFEWVDIPPHEGHPHMLTAPALQEWIGARGNVVQLNERGCTGKAFYGCFRHR